MKVSSRVVELSQYNLKPAEILTLPSTMASHQHEHPQVVIGLQGQAEFDILGCGSVLNPGQGCIVSSRHDHAFGGFQSSPDILVLNLPSPSHSDPVFLDKINEIATSHVYFQLDQRLKKIIEMLVFEMNQYPDDVLLSRACHDTLVALMHTHITGLSTGDRRSRLNIDLLDQYIDTHIARRISVAQLAGCVFLGESQFYRLFKEKMSLTPHQYVLIKRVEHACELIKQGHLPLGQVAGMTGFSSQSTFTHTFTRLQGLSPSAFKKRYG